MESCTIAPANRAKAPIETEDKMTRLVSVTPPFLNNRPPLSQALPEYISKMRPSQVIANGTTGLLVELFAPII
jgi:hypothetical protein